MCEHKLINTIGGCNVEAIHQYPKVINIINEDLYSLTSCINYIQLGIPAPILYRNPASVKNTFTKDLYKV